MKRINILLLILLFISSFTKGQVFETERGKIELLGLKKWDAKTLLDSMKSLNPNKPIHACAGQMKHDFGFTEVSSIAHIEDFNDLSTMYSIVTVVEDNENGKIKYLEKHSDTLAVQSQYCYCDSLLNDNPMIYLVELQTYNLFRNGNIDSVKTVVSRYRLDFEIIKPFFDFLLSKNTISDMNLALWTLNNDANAKNRKIAISILLNFKKQDSVWWTLMNLQRDKNQMLSMPAIDILRTFANTPHEINWEPAISSIKYILNGTNLFAFLNSLDVLTKTKISSNLSRSILENSSGMIMSYLNAEHDKTREVAVNFIQQISGNEELNNPEDCKIWLGQFM